jgi:hypothetical protein
MRPQRACVHHLIRRLTDGRYSHLSAYRQLRRCC